MTARRHGTTVSVPRDRVGVDVVGAFHAVVSDPSTGAPAGLAGRVERQRERLAALVAGPDPDVDQLLRARTAIAVLHAGALLADPVDVPGERLPPHRQRVLVAAALAALRSRPDRTDPPGS